jgi:hypothetical protein
MIPQATKYNVSVEIPAKSLDLNLVIAFDDNWEINKSVTASFTLTPMINWSVTLN